MRWTRGSVGAVAMLTATLVLMLVGITVGFESFNGKGFVARIVIYPIEVWDDVNHLVNWFLLMWGVGLLVFATPGSVRSRPVLAVFTVGALGALLAVGWEVGEWYVFLQGWVEDVGLYQDTIGDQVLGTSGAFVAGLLVLWWRRRGADVLAA